MERYKRKGNKHLGPLQVKVSLDFLKILDEAAKRRNVNRATFIRRACAVQMASVLDRDLLLILRLGPSAKPWGNTGARNLDTSDDGDGIENWCTHPGCDGRHLT